MGSLGSIVHQDYGETYDLKDRITETAVKVNKADNFDDSESSLESLCVNPRIVDELYKNKSQFDGQKSIDSINNGNGTFIFNDDTVIKSKLEGESVQISFNEKEKLKVDKKTTLDTIQQILQEKVMLKLLEEVLQSDGLYQSDSFMNIYNYFKQSKEGIWGVSETDFKLDKKGRIVGPTEVDSDIVCRQFDHKGRDHGVEFYIKPNQCLVLRRWKKDNLHGRRMKIYSDGRTEITQWQNGVKLESEN